MSNFSHSFEINHAWVCACAAYDNFWFVFFCQFFQFSIVDSFGFRIYTVRNNVEISTGNIDRAAVGQMTAMRKIHTHDSVAWLQEGKINSGVGISARMRLYIGMFSTKKLFGTFNSQSFNFIDVFAATVVTVSGIPFRIFVSQDCAHGFHNCGSHKVFRCNQFNFVALPA